MEVLADQAKNLGYDYVTKIFQQYHDTELSSRNGKLMFEHLAAIVEDYNRSGQERAIMQEYDARSEKAFILCIVTNLMARVHEKVIQAGEICYIDASASFIPLNNSITLLYTSCAVGALPLGLFITSDEFEVTLEKAVIIIISNLLKMNIKIIIYYLIVI